MAKIKLSGLVSDIRGSISGMTFQQSGSGLVLKKKPRMGSGSKPFNIAYDKFLRYTVQARKAAFSEALTMWHSFTPETKTTWNNFANSFPYYGMHGGKVKYSGKNYFIALIVRMRMHSPNYFNIPSPPVINNPLPFHANPFFEIFNTRLYIGFSDVGSSIGYRGFSYYTYPTQSYSIALNKRFDFVTIMSGESVRAPYFWAQLLAGFPVPNSGDWVKYGLYFHDPVSGCLSNFRTGLVQYNL